MPHTLKVQSKSKLKCILIIYRFLSLKFPFRCVVQINYFDVSLKPSKSKIGLLTMKHSKFKLCIQNI